MPDFAPRLKRRQIELSPRWKGVRVWKFDRAAVARAIGCSHETVCRRLNRGDFVPTHLPDLARFVFLQRAKRGLEPTTAVDVALTLLVPPSMVVSVKRALMEVAARMGYDPRDRTAWGWALVAMALDAVGKVSHVPPPEQPAPAAAPSDGAPPAPPR